MVKLYHRLLNKFIADIIGTWILVIIFCLFVCLKTAFRTSCSVISRSSSLPGKPSKYGSCLPILF